MYVLRGEIARAEKRDCLSLSRGDTYNRDCCATVPRILDLDLGAIV